MNLLRCLVVVLCLSGYVYADDTEIYGTITTTTLEPNVLIVFDTSGSMETADVPGNQYNPVDPEKLDFRSRRPSLLFFESIKANRKFGAKMLRPTAAACGSSSPPRSGWH